MWLAFKNELEAAGVSMGASVPSAMSSIWWSAVVTARESVAIVGRVRLTDNPVT